MDLAWISVIALAVTVLVSCVARLNPGVLAIAFAWIITTVIAPMLGQSIAVKELLAGFPTDVFVTLSGTTLLFALAQVNGTLDRAAQTAVRWCRGNAALIPLAFFSIAAVISAVGAGSVATAALIAPTAMAAAGNARIPAFVMAIMVGHGAIAGGMSPFAMTGIIANGLMERMGLRNYQWETFFHNLAANAFVAALGYVLFGGLRLFRQTAAVPPTENAAETSLAPESRAIPRHGFERQHRLTLLVLALLIVAAVGLKIHVGMAAFSAAAVLMVVRAADEQAAFRAMPWSVILMVCGVTMLTSLIERTGGIDRITDVIAAVSTARTLPGILAFSTGVVSVYSSTSGVVLPAFLPAVPSLVEKVGDVDPVSLASSINIGGNLVDVSPLSTIGALCIASAAASEDRRLLFYQVLAWGLSMSLISGILCTLFFGTLRS